MVAVKLKRVIHGGPAGTFGIMDVGGIPFAVTLEPTDPIIPEGQYICHWYKSPKRHDWCYLIQNVFGHEGVEIHIGNVLANTDGCILVGVGVGKVNIKDNLIDGILQSGTALSILRNRTGNANQFVLNVEN